MNRLVLSLAVCAALVAGAAQAHGFRIGALEIGHPWSRPAPAGGNGAGFLTIRNTGTVEDRLLSVSTPAATRVEIHESMVMNGTMMMHPRPGGATIPAGGTLELKPGSWHLMMIGLKRPFALGDRIPATLVFKKAGKVEVEFVVQAMPPAATGAAGQMPEHKH